MKVGLAGGVINVELYKSELVNACIKFNHKNK